MKQASIPRNLMKLNKNCNVSYEEFNDFDTREIKWIEALRTARMVYYSAWLARRWGDPAFPAAFPWFGQERYWADQILALREQLALLEEEPLRLL